MGIGKHEAGYQGVHGDAEKSGVNARKNKNAPGAKGLQGGEPGGDFEEESILERQGLIVSEPRETAEAAGRMAKEGNQAMGSQEKPYGSPLLCPIGQIGGATRC
jgi:hypothetical protein